MTNSLFDRVHSISMYVPDLEAVLGLYLALGLEPDRTHSICSDAGDVSQIALRFTGGGPFLLLHDDVERQFVEVVVLVEDLSRTYADLSRHPRLNWLVTPNRGTGSRKAVVRLPDGNLFTMVDNGESLERKGSG